MMQTYRLKGIYPAIFASEVLHSNTDTAWIVAAFGVGGIAGSYIFKWAVKAKVPEDTKSSSLPNPASESHIAKSNSVKDKPSGSFVLWAGILLIVFAWVWLPARLMSMVSSERLSTSPFSVSLFCDENQIKSNLCFKKFRIFTFISTDYGTGY